MKIVLCATCGEPLDCQVHEEHVTAGCVCGARFAAQYVFSWKQIPGALRAQATKAFGVRGKWRIQPVAALKHALQRLHAECSATSTCASAAGSALRVPET